MQVAQRKKNNFTLTRTLASLTGNTKAKNCRTFVVSRYSGLLAGFLVSVLTSSSSFAAINGISVAATYPTPQGFAYQTLEHGFGLQAEAWMDSPSFLSHMFPQMHFALNYEPFSVRGLSPANLAAMGITSGLGVTMVGAFVGLQAQTGDYGHSFTPFFTIDFGAVFDTMTYINTSSVNSNSGSALAAQLVPGFDMPVAGHVGVIVELPVKIYNLKNTLTIWDVVVGLRLKL